MRVCPKCGYHDPAIWRNSRFHFNVDVADIDSLEFWGMIELAKELRKKKIAHDDIFAYYLQGGHRVLRKEIEFLAPGSRDLDDIDKRIFIRMEKHKKLEHSNQRRLDDVSPKTFNANTKK